VEKSLKLWQRCHSSIFKLLYDKRNSSLRKRRQLMTTEAIVLIIVIALVIGALPTWPHSQAWGYGPTGVLIILLFIFCIWAVSSGRPLFRSNEGNIETTTREVGESLKSTGRDVADSIRKTAQ
jgi:hypothetical protein